MKNKEVVSCNIRRLSGLEAFASRINAFKWMIIHPFKWWINIHKK